MSSSAAAGVISLSRSFATTCPQVCRELFRYRRRELDDLLLEVRERLESCPPEQSSVSERKHMSDSVSSSAQEEIV